VGVEGSNRKGSVVASDFVKETVREARTDGGGDNLPNMSKEFDRLCPKDKRLKGDSVLSHNVSMENTEDRGDDQTDNGKSSPGSVFSSSSSISSM